MPLNWTTKPDPSRLLEEPKIVLATPGSLTPRHRLTQVLAAGSLLAMGLRPAPLAASAPATAYLVTNLLPSGSGSLLKAVTDANAHPGPDIVNFQVGLTGTIPITRAIGISDSVQIVGPGPGLLAVSGGNARRIFYLYSASVFTTTISGLTLRDGSGGSLGGGAILDQAQPLTLDHVNLISNTTQNRGGAVVVTFGTAGHGALTIRNSLVTGNHADNNGGGVAAYYMTGDLQISNTQFISNTSALYGGGGLFASGAPHIAIAASSFISNSAGANGGGIYFYFPGLTTLQNLTLSGNSATKGGGLALHNSTAITIENTTLDHNHASNGGGIFSYYNAGPLTIKNSRLLTNTADTGAGVSIEAAVASIVIEDTDISGNQADSYGGGVAFYQTAFGTHIIRRTTISGNGAQQGGGLWLYRAYAPFALDNATVSGNGALSGGGLIVKGSPLDQLSVRHSTIVSNSAAAEGGGILLDAGAYGALTITNTIVANNTAINDPDLGSLSTGAFVLSYDLVEVTATTNLTNAGGNLFGLDPLLGPLANNGGPTKTHLPLHGSPAIDTGDPAFAPPPSTDQRGQPRKVHGRIDIGAVETAAEVLKLFLPLVRR